VQRLKRHDLVMAVLSLISEEFERSDAESIWDVRLPLSAIRGHLTERYGVGYSSDQWLNTQLRRYEDTLGVPLFARHRFAGEDGSRRQAISLYPEMVHFYQKQHLHMADKIKVANGTYDFISRSVAASDPTRECRGLLGAGSTVYHLARIFADRSHSGTRSYRLYTHNAAFIQTFLNENVDYSRLSVVAIGGELEPVTRTILGEHVEAACAADLDFVVQGTSRVCEGRLYIESGQEWNVKTTILRGCSGCKILVCTKHEFADQPLADSEPYGSLQEYDYLVVPRSWQENPRKRYEQVFREHERFLKPEILHWNYAIYSVVS